MIIMWYHIIVIALNCMISHVMSRWPALSRPSLSGGQRGCCGPQFAAHSRAATQQKQILDFQFTSHCQAEKEQFECHTIYRRDKDFRLLLPTSYDQEIWNWLLQPADGLAEPPGHRRCTPALPAAARRIARPEGTNAIYWCGLLQYRDPSAWVGGTGRWEFSTPTAVPPPTGRREMRSARLSTGLPPAAPLPLA